MMGIIVSKFGGSSMADAVMFQKVREIIRQKRHPHYIVLSAPGKRWAGDEKITDLLCRAHSVFSAGGNPDDIIAKIRLRFSEIITALNITMEHDLLTEHLENNVRHFRDCAASRGEYLCARIFAEYTDLPFVDAAELIHFDGNGRLLHEKTYESIRKMAARLPCAVIPGFYGSLPSGEIKTFTRGGSDITGALIAAALHADIYENWTDVDGLMSIDPRICSDAVHYPAVSYSQMQSMANAGANVLHPYCLEPVRRAGIPTEIRNTFKPDCPGTYISDCVRKQVPCICVQDGLRALPLDTVSIDTAEILNGLSPELYLTDDRRKILRLRAGEYGTPSSCISVFSLPSDQHPEATRLIRHLGFLSDDEALRILVAEEERNDAAQTLHHILLKHI